MSRRPSRGAGPMAVAGVIGLCGLALAYVVVRPLFVGPNRAGAESPSGGPVRDPVADAAPGATPGPGAAPNPSGPQVREPRTGGPAAPTLDSLVNEARRTERESASPPAPADGAPAPGAAPPVTPVPPGGASSDAVAAALRSAEAEVAANRPVVAREVLLRAMRREGLSALDQSRLRDQISRLNDEIIFSPRVFADDPFTSEYTVRSGDSLSRIVSRQGLAVDWRAIQRVNRMTTESIREGQRLKVIRGPFHAVVDKSDYRLDLYAGPPDERGEWVYIRSFTVGLGEGDGTPLGEFVVKRHSRLINPVWVNPRTGERFAADDPANPIGERWVGIRGLGEYEVIEGYGIHGTIDPGSIGQQRSMGCVRMLSGDVELVYELLSEEISRVTIEP